MDKAKARRTQFAFLRMKIFLSLAAAIVCVFGLNVFAGAKERVELSDSRQCETMRSDEFERVRLRLGKQCERILEPVI
jgi:hypothetical protein